MTQDELLGSSQRQNQSFDSFVEEDEEIDVGIEDDSDEEVSKNYSKSVKDSNKEVSKNDSTTIKDSNKVIFSFQHECGSLLGVERFRGVRGFGIDELLSHKGTNEVCLLVADCLLLFYCWFDQIGYNSDYR